VNVGEYLPGRSRCKYSPISTEPEENTACFSIVLPVKIRETEVKKNEIVYKFTDFK
jgi:hypothetical protein